MKIELNTILSSLRNLYPYLKEKYDINSIEIFGSFVRNEQDKQSDLDLLVTFKNTPSLLKFIELKNFLSDKLQISVDLVMKDALKPRINNYILDEVVPV